MAEPHRAEYGVDAHSIKSLSHGGYPGVTLLYVCQGQLTVNSDLLNATLQTGDVALINKNHPYRLNSLTDNVVIRLTVSNHYFSRYYKRYFQHSFCLPSPSATSPQSKHLHTLKNLLTKLLLTHSHGHDDFALLAANQCLSEILLILVLYFKTENPSAQRRNSAFSKRINKVMALLDSRYPLNLSLTEIAQAEHISLAYLSRLFKKEVGLSFRQYVLNLKFEHAVRDLVDTAKPLYQIAQEHGFHSTKPFIQRFKQTYQQTPNQFRAHYKNNAPESAHSLLPALKPPIHAAETPTLIDPIDAQHLLALIHDTPQRHDVPTTRSEHYYPVDAQTIALNHDKKNTPLPQPDCLINVGELHEVLKQTTQQQLLLLQQSARVDYVAIYHLISGSTILPDYPSDEPIPSLSPYTLSDQAIAFLKRNRMALFIHLSHHTLCADPEAYEHKLAQFIAHNINVFGLDYLQSWRFIYTASDQDTTHSPEFERCFLHLKQRLNAWLTHAQLGVLGHFPEPSSPRKDPFFTSALIQAADFLGYCANPNEQINLAQVGSQSLAHSERYVQEKTQNIRNSLKYHDLNLPLCLLTWNTLTGDTRYTNGRFFRGALILKTLIDLSRHVSSIGFWLNTEYQQEALPERINISSLALFHIYNTKRPAFHALSFRSRLHGHVVAAGPDYFVTQTQQGYQVVLTNATAFNPYISVKEHLMNNFRKEKTFVFQGMQPGIYQIKQFIFDQQHGALYRQFERFPTQYGKDEEIMTHLSQAMPSLSVYDEHIETDWRIISALDINAVHFYELRRVS
ncbi:MAG: helix-turn-helix domain-containing protein [Neisseriaceae bacterium]|nr:helix-turn-helix domain-containing protein [Neisseriaceae bacterium]